MANVDTGRKDGNNTVYRVNGTDVLVGQTTNKSWFNGRWFAHVLSEGRIIIFGLYNETDVVRQLEQAGTNDEKMNAVQQVLRQYNGYNVYD